MALVIFIKPCWIQQRKMNFLFLMLHWFYSWDLFLYWGPIWHLLVSSQQRKHQNNTWNLFKVDNNDTRTRSIIFNFDQISHIVLLLLLFTLNKSIPAREWIDWVKKIFELMKNTKIHPCRGEGRLVPGFTSLDIICFNNFLTRVLLMWYMLKADTREFLRKCLQSKELCDNYNENRCKYYFRVVKFYYSFSNH